MSEAFVAQAAYALVGIFEIAMFAASALVLFVKNHRTPAVLVGLAALMGCLDFGISMAYPLFLPAIVEYADRTGDHWMFPVIMAVVRAGFTAISAVQWGLVVIAVFVGREVRSPSAPSGRTPGPHGST